MIVNLSPGDELVIQFEDTDGEFRVHFDTTIYPDTITIEEISDHSDDKGRKGILYQNDFSIDWLDEVNQQKHEPS